MKKNQPATNPANPVMLPDRLAMFREDQNIFPERMTMGPDDICIFQNTRVRFPGLSTMFREASPMLPERVAIHRNRVTTDPEGTSMLPDGLYTSRIGPERTRIHLATFKTGRSGAQKSITETRGPGNRRSQTGIF